MDRWIEIQWPRGLGSPATIEWPRNGDTVVGGLPGFSPATVDGGEKLDGARIRDQLDVANTDGVFSELAVARFDGSVSPKSGTGGGPPAILAPVT